MQKFNKFLNLVILSVFPLLVSGQNYNNNPYSRFGVGDLVTTGFGYNRSLGGSSIALRLPNQINYLNPASYTSQDTLSFLFQGGVSAQRSHIETNLADDDANNMNVEYLAMGFPITKWFKFSFGLTPFSRVSYLYQEFQPEAEDIAIENKGSGGFNDFYFGGALQPFKFLSVGFNAQYLFGKINRSTMVDIPGHLVAGTSMKQEYIASNLHYRFGLQIHPVIAGKKEKKHRLTLGVIYDLPVELNLGYSSLASRNFPSHISRPITDTFNVLTDSSVILKLPAKFGVGLTYTLNERLMITAEYSKQAFSKGIGDMAEINELNDYSSIRFGADFIPVPLTSKERSNYFERVHYCLGGHYTNTYLRLNNTPIKDYGFSLGFVMPLRNQQKLYTYSTFSLTYEYGVRGTTEQGLIKENYHLVTLGITLHDYWFMKPKYD
jgi:hypothetical protein